MVTGVFVPRWGITMERGRLVTWLVKAGEPVKKGQPLFEMETEKITNVVEALGEGVLRVILCPEGATPQVGELIAVIAEPDEEFDLDALRGAGASVSDTRSESLEKRELTSAEQTQGRRIRAAPAARKLAQQYGLDLASIPGTGPEGSVSREDVERARIHAVAVGPGIGANTTVETTLIRLSPVVARMIAENQITDAELATIKPTGEGGRIGKKDIEDFLSTRHHRKVSAISAPGREVTVGELPQRTTVVAGQSAPAAGLSGPGARGNAEILPLSTIRRAIAEHMVKSKHVSPHVTSVHEVDMTRVIAYQKAHADEYAKQDVKLTLTAFCVQATASALKAFPIVNAAYTDKGIVLKNDINIGVAVALEEGLVVPVIRNADEKSLFGIARAVNDLAARARGKRLQPDEVQGGTFTITNYGVFGSLFGTPIINQPESAILGVGATQQRVVVIDDAIAIRPMVYLGITFDHRLLDGSISDRFMQKLKAFLETYNA